jgi:hypothetical protein
MPQARSVVLLKLDYPAGKLQILAINEAARMGRRR